jgi:predicted small lipoprotein YifL
MPMKLFLTAALIAALTLAGCGDSGPSRTPSGPNAKVFFIEPSDGAEVSSPVTVKFGIEGMDVVPAGMEKVHSGHHHVLIDTKLENFETAIPADDNHKHFGGGQTETQLELSPGKHTLQLVLGDHNHIPHDPVVQSDVITITVK